MIALITAATFDDPPPKPELIGRFFCKQIFTKNSFFTIFSNTGCLIYPASFTCFEQFSWSIPIGTVEQMNLWYEQWSKAGAGPNFRIENPEIYILKFNWVPNWFEMYFFTKVSDNIFVII